MVPRPPQRQEGRAGQNAHGHTQQVQTLAAAQEIGHIAGGATAKDVLKGLDIDGLGTAVEDDVGQAPEDQLARQRGDEGGAHGHRRYRRPAIHR